MPNQFTFTGPPVINVTRWVFFDPTDASTNTFELNPSDGGELSYQRNITTQARVAPGAKTVIYVNADGAKEFTFTGTILTQSMYNLFVLWFNKKHPIEVTDDLLRTHTIFITKFEPKRVLHATVPWFHTYTVTGTVI